MSTLMLSGMPSGKIDHRKAAVHGGKVTTVLHNNAAQCRT